MPETKYLIITNNSLSSPSKEEKLLFICGTALDVLVKVRDHMHEGWELITHPLTGNIKPSQIRFKTIYLRYSGNDKPDVLTVSLISDTIYLLERTKPENLNEETINDLMFIDWELSKMN
ncbi:MAG: hypothetical protein DDT41_00756 [candidate division WS2 bacterium]|nr:hypothetical protein [Candidatus Psychracetigena formicireducens]